jgi:hypothetical protein
MSEADEIAKNIIKMCARKPANQYESLVLTTAYMGPPSEVGYQLHDNIAEAIWRLSK